MMNELSYHEMIRIPSYVERLKYLMRNGKIGDQTFGGFRQLNQLLYQSTEWKAFRRDVIIRDNAFDLAHPDHPIASSIYIHHIMPLTVDDVRNRSSKVFDFDNVISCAFKTHNIIHYGSSSWLDFISDEDMERKENDTCLWR